MFISQVYHVLPLLLPVELQYFNNRNTNKHEILHILFLACEKCYIFVNPFTCVIDRYRLQQYIMETETETNMKICMYKDFIMGMCTMFLYFR